MKASKALCGVSFSNIINYYHQQDVMTHHGLELLNALLLVDELPVGLLGEVGVDELLGVREEEVLVTRVQVIWQQNTCTGNLATIHVYR